MVAGNLPWGWSVDNARQHLADGVDPATGGRRFVRPGTLIVMVVVTTATLLLLVVTLAVLASGHVAASTVSAAASADRALAEALLERIGADATRPPEDVADELRLGAALRETMSTAGLLGLALHGPGGEAWASTGERPPARGAPGSWSADEASAVLADDEAGRPRLVEAFPVRLNDRTESTLVVLRDGAPVMAASAEAQRDVALAAGAGATVVLVLVTVVVRAVQRRLAERTAQLIEAERRDPLTGHLTHGAVLTELGHAMEADLQPIAVAMVDIDNFQQLNEAHGHEFGDAVIRRVASRLAAGVPGLRIGRSGPDEFLLVAAAVDASSLSAALVEANDDLMRTGIDTADGDALPLTVSAGIAVAPLHGRSVSELISAAALTVGEAKSGGGASILVSRLSYADLVGERRATFSVLDGLVTAIDARDRYTRAHSEDVARYALFLAGRLGLERPLREAIHRAALLHDVGKIAVPDDVLRKPAALTQEEFEIIQQHPLVGGTLVRDLNAADLVSDGVRHHHERWDGTGYPDRLAGEDIPLIARVIAVADAYSAMTTTRPYRRSLRPSAALQELIAVAGTQLDPRLTDVFVLAMESVAEAPAPSDARAPTAWLGEVTAA